ncbi:MAG TPA: glycosyltransferase [Rhodothermia bacterium]
MVPPRLHMDTPRVSVVVRSLGRLASLIELLERLLAQDHDSFEIVVIEQTPEPDPDLWARVQDLSRDTRLRVLKRPPLGGPRARNTGVLEARGDIIILIDDDDLPVSSNWIAHHENAYDDPSLVGLTGRHVQSVGEKMPYIRFLRPFIRKRCMRYSFLKTAYTYARFDEDVDNVEWLHGTNSSFRREIVERAGLWDTTVTTQDEHSFAFRLHDVLLSNEYLAFRVAPAIIRRLDIPGGMAKRRARLESELASHLGFVFRVVGAYYPVRFRLLFPLYLLWAAGRTTFWIWSDSRPNATAASRLADSLRLFLLLPVAVVRELRTGSQPSPPASS